MNKRRSKLIKSFNKKSKFQKLFEFYKKCLIRDYKKYSLEIRPELIDIMANSMAHNDLNLKHFMGLDLSFNTDETVYSQYRGGYYFPIPEISLKNFIVVNAAI